MVIAADVGGTTTRIGVVEADGSLAGEVIRFATPPDRDRLFDELTNRIRYFRRVNPGWNLQTAGVSFGAVVTNRGVVENASILWREAAIGFDVADAIRRRIGDLSVFVVNDVSAAAWRYREEGRYLLVTVSTGVAAKVFDERLETPYKLSLDDAGLGGEMGHVVVNPAAVQLAVEKARTIAGVPGSGFCGSRLEALVGSDPAAIHGAALGRAALDRDPFAIRLLEAMDVPYCECGSLGDLCAYSSGPAAVRMAQVMAGREPSMFAQSVVSRLCGGRASAIDTFILSRAALEGDAFANAVFSRATFFLALRILQLCADLGLDKVRVTGGFANGGGKPYFDALHSNIMRLAHPSGYFTSWKEADFRKLILPCPDHANDSLIGVGLIAHERAHWYRAACKPPLEARMEIRTRRRERCGAEQVAARILYAGICSTDLQIYRGERGYEPLVPGHECVAVAMETGDRVTGLQPGGVFAINPNNPLDDFDKIGHTREGCFQEWFTFHRDLIDKRQVVPLGGEARPEWVLLELLACVLHAQDHMGDWQGREVLIVGSGITGMLHAELARLRGASRIWLANRSRAKLDAAVRLGIVDPLDSLELAQLSARTDIRGADRIVIALAGDAGPGALQSVLPCAADGTCIGLFGGFLSRAAVRAGGGQFIDCDRIRREHALARVRMADGRVLTCAGSRGSTAGDYERAFALAADGRPDLRKFISRLIPLSELPSAMEELARSGTIGGELALRVVVDLTKDLNGTILPVGHRRAAASGG